MNSGLGNHTKVAEIVTLYARPFPMSKTTYMLETAHVIIMSFVFYLIMLIGELLNSL
jgi:hypothetical protein